MNIWLFLTIHTLILDQLQRLKYIDRTMFIFKNLFCFIDEKYIFLCVFFFLQFKIS